MNKVTNEWKKRNRGRHKKYQRKYNQEHKAYFRDYWLKSNYGISLERYEKMYDKQRGNCLICNQEETVGNQYGQYRLSIDHDHETGRVRGLLCNRCNRGLGYFKHSKKILLNALKYLSQSANLERKLKWKKVRQQLLVMAK